MLPRIQSPAPAFTAIAVFPNHETRTLSLGDYRGHYVLLLFFPAAFSVAFHWLLTPALTLPVRLPHGAPGIQ